MNRITSSAFALAALATVAIHPAQAQIAYGLNNAGANLIRYDLSTPNTFTTVAAISGAVTNLGGLDFRPSNGLVYGFDQVTNRLVTINLTTGVTTLADTLSTNSSNANFGLDFNPTADRLRLVNSQAQNLRVNIGGGAPNTTVDGTLTYANGDVNFGANPSINESAYTNNVAGAASTTIYYLDYGTDSLATTTAPNGSGGSTIITTVGTDLGIGNFSLNTGFDIYSPSAGVNNAVALLQVGGNYSLYNINLTTGTASTLGGSITGLTNARGLAIVPSAAPEASSAALLLGGLTSIAGIAIRRRKAK